MVSENKKKVDPEFMRKIGSKGGKNSTSRPFRDKPGLAKAAGKKSWENLKKKQG